MTLEGVSPKLRPVQKRPSPESPDKESVLIDTGSGQALVLQREETDALNDFDGSEVREIASRIWSRGVRPLTTLGLLLRHLDRFGFLESGALPVLEHAKPKSWHVWVPNKKPETGQANAEQVTATTSPFGRVVSSSGFLTLCLIVLAGTLAVWRLRPIDATPLLIGDSPAIGTLVFLVSTFVGSWLGGWVQAQAVSAASGYRCALGAELGFGIPLPWLDMSPTLVVPRATRYRVYATAPALVLALGCLVYLICRALPSAAAGDVGVQVISGTWAAILIYTSPWWRSPYTHLAMVYLRKPNPLGLGIDALRALVFFVFGSKPQGESHHSLLTAWGIWAIGWPLVAVRVLSAAFRRDLPLLTRMLADESGTAAWWGLLGLTAVISLGVLAVVVSTTWFFASGLYRIVHHRWWPERIGVLAGCGFVLALALLWRLESPHDYEVSLAAPAVGVLLGALLIFCSWRLPLRDLPGLEALPYAATGLAGLFLFLESSGATWSAGGWGWLAVACFTLLSLGCWGGAGRVWLAVAAVAGLLSAGICAVWGQKNLMPGAFATGVCLVRFIASLRGRDRLAWGWLLGAVLADTVGSLAASHGQWPALALFVRHAGCVAAIAALVSRAGMRAFTMSADEQANVEAYPLELLGREIQGLTGFAHPSVDSGSDFNAIHQRLCRCLGTNTWTSVVMRWVPQLRWHEAVEYLKTVETWKAPLNALDTCNDGEFTEALRRVPCLRGADTKDHNVSSIARLLIAHPGDVLIRQGKTDDALFMIHEGRVAIEIEEGGIGSTTLAQLEPGAYVGEIAFLTGRPRTATVRAVDPLLAYSLRRADVETAWPELGEHLREKAEDAAWNHKLRELPVFNEMSESLFLRTTLQGEPHHLQAGESLETGDGPPPVVAVLDGQVKMSPGEERESSQSKPLLGMHHLWSTSATPIQFTAETPAWVVSIPRDLMQEAVEEIVLDAEI